MSLLFGGIGFGLLLAWFVWRALGDGMKSEPVMPFGAPAVINSARLALALRKGRR